MLPSQLKFFLYLGLAKSYIFRDHGYSCSFRLPSYSQGDGFSLSLLWAHLVAISASSAIDGYLIFTQPVLRDRFLKGLIRPCQPIKEPNLHLGPLLSVLTKSTFLTASYVVCVLPVNESCLPCYHHLGQKCGYTQKNLQ